MRFLNSRLSSSRNSRKLKPREYYQIYSNLLQSQAYLVAVKCSEQDKLKPILEKYHDVIKNNSLLKIPFTTLSEYLLYLRASAQSVTSSGVKSMFYLAAAVSDFYIPPEEMVNILPLCLLITPIVIFNLVYY